MTKSLAALLIVMGAAVLVQGAGSASAHKYHRVTHRHHWTHDVVLYRGYSRRGPPYGYRFGFVTYRGDPFAHDDYYDGHSCYYLHHRDFCLAFRKPLGLPH